MYLYEIGVFIYFCANKTRRIDRIMNKKQFLAAAFLFDGTCRMYAKTELPENPKDQEEYRDHQETVGFITLC